MGSNFGLDESDALLVQYSTVQYSTVQYSTVQYSTVQYSTVQYSTVQYSTVQYSTVQYSTVQYSTVQYSTVQYRAEDTGILPAEKYGLVKLIESIFLVTEVKLRTFENAPQKCVKTVKI